MVKRSFHGVDIIVLKAIGVVFNFKNGKLQEVQHHLNFILFIVPNVIYDPFSDLEFELIADKV